MTDTGPEPHDLAHDPAGARAEPELPPGLLGRASPRPGITYRMLRRIWAFAAWVLRVRLELEGVEHLPREAHGRVSGRWIAAVVPHRTWVDPFVPWILLPERPRFALFGDARTMARSPLRRFLMRRLGGVIPIPAGRDPRTVELHLEAARRVLDAGMPFMLMPETGAASKPGELRRIGGGMAYVALRNDVPIVPLVLGGNHELYVGRRIILRVLPAMSARDLAGIPPADPIPNPRSSAERRAAHQLTLAFVERVAAAVLDAHERAEPPPGTRKRGRRLTTMFR